MTDKAKTSILFFQWNQESNVQYEMEIRVSIPLDHYRCIFKAVLTKEQFAQCTKGIDCKPMPGGLFYTI